MLTYRLLDSLRGSSTASSETSTTLEHSWKVSLLTALETAGCKWNRGTRFALSSATTQSHASFNRLEHLTSLEEQLEAEPIDPAAVLPYQTTWSAFLPHADVPVPKVDETSSSEDWIHALRNLVEGLKLMSKAWGNPQSDKLRRWGRVRPLLYMSYR